MPTYGIEIRAGDTYYGLVSINDFGTLAIRVVNEFNPARITAKVRVYMKPKHIRCWCPRPPRAVPYRGEGVDLKQSSITPLTPVTSITTYGFGHQNQAVYVAVYKIVNYHLATAEDFRNCVRSMWERDLMVVESKAQGSDQIARCPATGNSKHQLCMSI